MAPRTPGERRSVFGQARAALQMVRPQLEDLLGKNLINLGAVAGTCLLLAGTGTVSRAVGAVLALAAALTITLRRGAAALHPRRPGLLGYFVSVRVILFLAVGAGYLIRRPDDRGWAWVGVAIAILLTLTEPMIKTLLQTTKQIVDGLPGVRSVPAEPFPAGWVTTASIALIGAGALCAALAVPGWLYLLLVLGTTPLAALLLRHALAANVISKRAERAIPGALARLSPKFAVYYAAVHGASYQLGMWLPYHERLNRPFVVITRQPETVTTIRGLTAAPILVPKTSNVSPSLDAMVVPSLRAAFYVQGSPANQTFQRYRQLTHVWLNHGDSDKQANFHPRHATYDKIFVSGQLGVDRYAAHGIEVPPERFVLVGRPQIEKIQVRDQRLPAGSARTVLYAPTWKGGRPSTDYSSLPVGIDLVRALIGRGSTVVFRPHPLSYEDRQDTRRIAEIHAVLAADQSASGRAHVWGQQAEKDWDVPDCFNASDALITDVSSIATDYLASGKPFAMVAITASGDAFRREFPMAQVAYLIERDLSTLDDALDHLHGDDPLAQDRRRYRRYCLGDCVGPEAAAPFLRIAGEIVDGRR